MKLLGRLFKTKDDGSLEVERPDNICPNCWGQQEYGETIRQGIYDKQIEVNNHSAVRSFITKYIEENITGSYLQTDNEGTYCPKCRTRYKDITFDSGT